MAYQFEKCCSDEVLFIESKVQRMTLSGHKVGRGVVYAKYECPVCRQAVGEKRGEDN